MFTRQFSSASTPTQNNYLIQSEHNKMNSDYIPEDIKAQLRKRHITTDFFEAFTEKTHILSETLNKALRQDEDNNKERQMLFDLIEKERLVYEKDEQNRANQKLFPDVLTPEEILAYDDVIHAMSHVKILARTQGPGAPNSSNGVHSAN